MTDPQHPPNNEVPSYEEAREELIEVVRRLEAGGTTLEESLALWERGERLYRECVERLDTAQGKIEELAQRVEASKPSQ